MRPYFSFVVLSLSFLAFVIMALIGNMPYWAWFLPAFTGIISTLVVFRGVYLPQTAVTRGMELIQSQDYNNRLVEIGEPSSDRIVSLFNSMIDKLRSERIQNREQEGLLSLLIEASPMGIVMLDLDNRISMVNRSSLKIFGIKNVSEMEGKKLDESDNEIMKTMTKIGLGKSEIIRQNNFKIYRVYHLDFFQEGFKREFYLIESLTDEIVKAETAAYEKVIRTISHEVNNTMGGVRSVLEIIMDQNINRDIREVVESCDRRCEGMGKFIQEYAEVVKLPEPLMKPIDLGHELDMMLPFLQHIVPEKIKMVYNQKPGEFRILGDSALLQQVVVNIVKNAVESIEDKGYIELDVSKGSTHIIMTISNNGKPIDSKTSSQLFTPFFTTKAEGKGIGLTLVRDVLSRHSAEYTLSTSSDGITRFVIYFKI